MSDRNRKINSKNQKFFQPKKAVFALPKFNQRKVRMSFQKLKAVLLKGTFRKKGKDRKARPSLKFKVLSLKSRSSFKILNFKFISNFKFKISNWRSIAKGLKGKVVLKKAFAFVTIFAVIVTAYLQNIPSGSSSDFALLTPKQKENIIQIIISNFTDIFGWAKFNK